MKGITVSQALSRTEFYHGSMAIKTVGRRVAQSWRELNPGIETPKVVEGDFTVALYPASFKNRIMRVAKRYSNQRDHEFIIKKRKRNRKPFANQQ